MSELILIERRGACCWLRINRPGQANALSLAVVEQLAEALRAAAADDAVRAVLLTGSGERVFSAGVDVKEQSGGDPAAHRKKRSDTLYALLYAALDFSKPLVAVLNGIASGGGAMLALVADARIAADTAAIALPEINLGIPTFSGAALVAHLGGGALAADLVQSGRRMPAAEALARGLLTGLSPAAELAEAAQKLAESLAAKDPGAYAAMKAWFSRPLSAALREAQAAANQHKKLQH